MTTRKPTPTSKAVTVKACRSVNPWFTFYPVRCTLPKGHKDKCCNVQYSHASNYYFMAWDRELPTPRRKK